MIFERGNCSGEGIYRRDRGSRESSVLLLDLMHLLCRKIKLCIMFYILFSMTAIAHNEALFFAHTGSVAGKGNCSLVTQGARLMERTCSQTLPAMVTEGKRTLEGLSLANKCSLSNPSLHHS